MPAAAPPPTFEVSVTPSKPSTKPAKLSLAIDAKTTNARTIVIYVPAGLGISSKGVADGASAGTGSITVDDAPVEIAPTVTATGLDFAADDTVLHGVFSQASGRYTAKLTIKVPQPLRAFSALSLDLEAKTLFGVKKCPLPFRVELLGSKKTVLTANAPCKP